MREGRDEHEGVAGGERCAAAAERRPKMRGRGVAMVIILEQMFGTVFEIGQAVH